MWLVACIRFAGRLKPVTLPDKSAGKNYIKVQNTNVY